ncbi:hypothetical protein [Acetobacter conturbans]|uniref:Uncharacterized protein n=1 Tax=Acetobacter conturbans TaxID=1737472 RepID=A0ABX0K1S5_9PROT|nr:hypothetical protein [Acetobacter conturbans]NHN88233.1 hypothetical protein [Acetobacter conturbans]
MNMSLSRRRLGILATAGGLVASAGTTAAAASMAAPSDIQILARTKNGEAFASYLVSFSPLKGRFTHNAVPDRPVTEPRRSNISIKSPELHAPGQPPVLLPTDLLAGIGLSHRLLAASHDMLWVFDDQQDCLLGVSCQKSTPPAVMQTLWLGGHRLIKALVSAENRIILGWDARQQILAAFNLQNGKLLSSLPMEADAVWLAKHPA